MLPEPGPVGAAVGEVPGSPRTGAPASRPRSSERAGCGDAAGWRCSARGAEQRGGRERSCWPAQRPPSAPPERLLLSKHGQGFGGNHPREALPRAVPAGGMQISRFECSWVPVLQFLQVIAAPRQQTLRDGQGQHERMKESKASLVYRQGRAICLMLHTNLNQQLAIYCDASSCPIKIIDLNYRSLSLCFCIMVLKLVLLTETMQLLEISFWLGLMVEHV